MGTIASLADLIEAYLQQMLEEEDDASLEVQRNELAKIFDCVPSQITYVLRTRFTPRHGYHVISVRGGGGYIKITRHKINPSVIHHIGESITEKEAYQFLDGLYQRQLMPAEKVMFIKLAVSDRTFGFSGVQANHLRSRMLKTLCQYVLSHQPDGVK